MEEGSTSCKRPLLEGIAPNLPRRIRPHTTKAVAVAAARGQVPLPTFQGEWRQEVRRMRSSNLKTTATMTTGSMTTATTKVLDHAAVPLTFLPFFLCSFLPFFILDHPSFFPFSRPSSLTILPPFLSSVLYI